MILNLSTGMARSDALLFPGDPFSSGTAVPVPVPFWGRQAVGLSPHFTFQI